MEWLPFRAKGGNMKGYKFVSSQYAEIVGRGSVRITPAHLFRPVDGFSDGRADPMELIASAQPKGGTFTIRSDHPALPDDMFVFIKGGKRVHHEMVMAGAQIDFIDNALLYCFSCRIDDVICAQMKLTFGADTLFEISDVELFGQILNCHPLLAGRTFRSGPVEYNDREPATTIEEPKKVNRCEKGKAFSWQQEHRFVWDGEPLGEPIDIDVPEAARLLKRLA